jgi:hypothetical protein
MSSREAFEKYVEEGEYLSYLSFDRDTSGEYCDRDTQSVWEGWQAATERAATIVSDEGPVIGSAGVAVVVAKIREGNE